MFQLKDFSSTTCDLKMLSYRNIYFVQTITCDYRKSSSVLSPQVHYTFFWQWTCYVTFIKYVINLIVPFHWAFCFFLQLHFGLWTHGFDVTFLLNPLMQYALGTVADFYGISVENFVKFVTPYKIFCYQLKEWLCNACWNGFAKRCVKPYIELWLY